MQMHKAFADKDLVLQFQSEFWVLMLFRCRKSNLLLIDFQTLNAFFSKLRFQSPGNITEELKVVCLGRILRKYNYDISLF